VAAADCQSVVPVPSVRVTKRFEVRRRRPKWLVIIYLGGVHGCHADVDRVFKEFCDAFYHRVVSVSVGEFGTKRRSIIFFWFGFGDVRTPTAAMTFGVFAPFWLVGTCRNLNGPRQPKPGVW